MYTFLNQLLSDKKGGEVFTCFGIWHWCYILLTFTAAFLLMKYLKNKNSTIRQSVIGRVIKIVFVLYISDFFLMPIAFGEIDIENLPFHICTAMCVMCFASRYNKYLSKFKANFALLGLISNFVYLIYPAGVMWYQVHPLSYRVIETMLFHGIMTIYGLLVLVYEERPSFTKSYRDLFVIIVMTAWAVFGNNLYNGISGDFSYKFNWFFVIRDPFNILPADYSRFIMPFLNILIFFIAEVLICLICDVAKRSLNHKWMNCQTKCNTF